MKIALATDHAGFEKLKELKTYLESKGHECIDYGPKEYDAADDYPDFIFPAAKAVASGECKVGIIMGMSGQGEAMAANRIKGVRCGLYYGDSVAQDTEEKNMILKLNREHNDANMLSLGARFLSQAEIEKAVDIWLVTDFSGEERHERRVAKLDEV